MSKPTDILHRFTLKFMELTCPESPCPESNIVHCKFKEFIEDFKHYIKLYLHFPLRFSCWNRSSVKYTPSRIIKITYSLFQQCPFIKKKKKISLTRKYLTAYTFHLIFTLKLKSIIIQMANTLYNYELFDKSAMHWNEEYFI